MEMLPELSGNIKRLVRDIPVSFWESSGNRLVPSFLELKKPSLIKFFNLSGENVLKKQEFK
jgi:hypothetical protein